MTGFLQTKPGRALLIGGAAIIVALVAATLAQPWRGETSASAQQAEAYRQAINLLEQEGGEAAALVNGRPIPLAKLKAYDVYLQQGHGPLSAEQELPFDNLEDYLMMLVDNELMYQEAEHLGLLPPDSEVVAFAKQVKSGLAAAMQDGSKVGDELRIALESIAGTSYDLATFDTSPVVLDAFRHTMAIGALRNNVIEAALSPEDRRDPVKREVPVNELLAQLRARASIELLVQAP